MKQTALALLNFEVWVESVPWVALHELMQLTFSLPNLMMLVPNTSKLV